VKKIFKTSLLNLKKKKHEFAEPQLETVIPLPALACSNHSARNEEAEFG